MSTHGTRRRCFPKREDAFPLGASHANDGVGRARGERWRRDGGVKMAAPRGQHRNSRRHPAGRRAAARAQRPCAGGDLRTPRSSRRAARRESLVPVPFGACRCRRAARPWAETHGPARCLTRSWIRIASKGENARKSEGFDVFRRPMSEARARSAVRGRSGSGTGRRGAPSGTRACFRGRACAAPWSCRGMAVAVAAAGDAALDRARGRCAQPPAQRRRPCWRRRGTRLAVASSRVRFRLGDAPGVEERAG